MLYINSSQNAVFCNSSRHKFDESVLYSVLDVWPLACERVGVDRIKSVVKTVVDTALACGFETEYDVVRFVHLAFSFESLNFTDEQWAVPVMLNDELPPRVRMNQLFSAALEYLKDVEKL